MSRFFLLAFVLTFLSIHGFQPPAPPSSPPSSLSLSLSSRLLGTVCRAVEPGDDGHDGVQGDGSGGQRGEEVGIALRQCRQRKKSRLRRVGTRVAAGAAAVLGRPLASRAQAKLAVSLDKPLRFGDVSNYVDRTAFLTGKRHAARVTCYLLQSCS